MAPSRPVWRSVTRWPLPAGAMWLSLPLLGIALGVLSRPINPWDYWYSLVLGRHTDVTGKLVRSNLFLYSFSIDSPYLPQAWLGHVALHRLFVFGGHRATALALSACLLLAWALVTDRALRRADSGRAAGLLATLGVTVTFSSFNVRTQMFAFPLWAACLWLLFGVADGALRFRFAWLVVPITALWANLHGSFVLAPLLVLVVGLGAVRRDRANAPRFALLLAACAAAGAASPLGLDDYTYLVRYFGTLRDVSEWERPKPLELQGALLILTLAGAVVLACVRWRAVRLHEALTLALTGAMALGAQRNDFWFAAALPVLLAPHAARPEREPTSPAQSVAHGLVVAGSVSAFVALLPGLALESARRAFVATSKPSGEGAGLLTRDHAIALVARAKALAGPERRVFHEQRLGGLVEWQLGDPARPTPVAFVDQRMEIIPERVWREYFDLSAGRGDWASVLNEHRVALLLLHRRTQAGLIAAAEGAHWQREGEEGEFVLLRQPPETVFP